MKKLFFGSFSLVVLTGCATSMVRTPDNLVQISTAVACPEGFMEGTCITGTSRVIREVDINSGEPIDRYQQHYTENHSTKWSRDVSNAFFGAIVPAATFGAFNLLVADRYVGANKAMARARQCAPGANCGTIIDNGSFSAAVSSTDLQNSSSFGVGVPLSCEIYGAC